ncbi:MAG: hypothetical protein ACLRFL_01625 [Clostridia bacterium]
MDGVRDNLVLSQTMGGETRHTSIYKTQSGVYVVGDPSNNLMYENNNNGVYIYYKDDGIWQKEVYEGYSDLGAYLTEVVITNLLSCLEKNAVVSVEILSGGDYKVTFVSSYDRGGIATETIYTKLVVNSDARIISVSRVGMLIDNYNEVTSGNIYDWIIEFRYGEVETELLLNRLEDAIECPLK